MNTKTILVLSLVEWLYKPETVSDSIIYTGTSEDNCSLYFLKLTVYSY